MRESKKSEGGGFKAPRPDRIGLRYPTTKKYVVSVLYTSRYCRNLNEIWYAYEIVVEKVKRNWGKFEKVRPTNNNNNLYSLHKNMYIKHIDI